MSPDWKWLDEQDGFREQEEKDLLFQSSSSKERYENYLRYLERVVEEPKIAAERAAAERAASLKNVTITCVKGKLTKKITSTNPKCPIGYKKKLSSVVPTPEVKPTPTPTPTACCDSTCPSAAT